jgi:hypothetical protein
MPYKDPQKEKLRQKKRKETPQYKEWLHNYLKEYRKTTKYKQSRQSYLNSKSGKAVIKKAKAKYRSCEANRKKEIETGRRYREKNRELINKKSRLRGRIVRLKKRGLTKQSYKNILLSQNNLCALCYKPFTKNNKPCMDHCHLTNKFRGLLHNQCNLLLGIAKDSTELLSNAIKYLKKTSTTNQGQKYEKVIS